MRPLHNYLWFFAKLFIITGGIIIMGTLLIGNRIHHFSYDPLETFRRYLASDLNPKLSLGERKEQKLDKPNEYLLKNGYKDHAYGLIDGKFIMVCSNPDTYYRHPLPDVKVTFHQSQWPGGQRQVAQTFTEIWGKHDAKTILCHGIISRSDFQLDGDVPFDIYMQSIYRPGRGYPKLHLNVMRSCYFGDSGPKRAVIYEKKLDKLDFRIFKNTASLPTRTEVRYFWGKVPIKTYADYIKTAEMQVFDFLRTSLIFKKQLYELSKLGKADPQSIKMFLKRLQKDGLHRSLRLCEKNKSIGPLIEQASTSLYLSERWQRKVRDEIVGDFDIHSFFNQGLS